MTRYCSENVEEMKALLKALSSSEYTRPIELLSSASIGQHVRHVVEFYLCLFKGLEHGGVVNYDSRERNLLLETNLDFAIDSLNLVCKVLSKITKDDALILKGDFSSDVNEGCIDLKSSLYRELAYNLEHSIHHQALIKVGLTTMGLSNLITPFFGLAPATIRHNKQVMVNE